MKKTLKLFSLLLLVCMLLSSCSQAAVEIADKVTNAPSGNQILDAGVVTPLASTDDRLPQTPSVENPAPTAPAKGTYNEGVALVKYDGEMNDNVLSQLDLVSVTPLFNGSS